MTFRTILQSLTGHLPKALLILLLFALVVPGPAVVSSQGDEFTLVWAYERGPSELDPQDPRGTPDAEIVTYMTHNSLLRLTTETENLIEPDLATSWDISEDGKIYTFYLRDDVYFWDDWGLMTAEDLVFTIERALANEELRVNSKIKQFIESVRAVDDFTLEITLLQPSPAFLPSIAAHYSTAAISKDAYETMTAEEFRLYPVGTGPYKPVSWEPGGNVSLEYHDQYFGGVPEVKQVQLVVQPDEAAAALALQKGEVHYVIVRGPSMWQALQDADNVVLNSDPSISTNILLMWLNTENPPLDDARVRQALLLGLDREAMADSIGEGMNGGVAHTLLPKSLFGHTEDVTQYPYDPERAQDLLEEAGYGDGFELTAITHRSGVYVPALEAAQAYWSQIGVDLKIDVVERLARNERLASGDFHINIMDVGRIEPAEFLTEFFYSPSLPPDGRAYTRFATPELDALIEAQNTELDPEQRKEYLHEAQQLLSDQLPILPLWYLLNVTAYNDVIEADLPNLYTWNTRFSEAEINR
jgi:peptide/nickel transport system substrate-binding protein